VGCHLLYQSRKSRIWRAKHLPTGKTCVLKSYVAAELSFNDIEKARPPPPTAHCALRTLLTSL
jgi:hypothetical protein